jgi:putative ABC transport system permease protein
VKFLPFVLKHLLRTWIRTGSTVVAMALSVALFCTLESVLVRFNRVVESRSPSRLVVRNAISIVFLLPRSYAEEIRKVSGVRRVAVMAMFGGLLPAQRETQAGPGRATDWSKSFQNVAVDAEPYFAMSPELIVPPDQFRDFMGDLRGCLVGRELADKFGWRIGDRFFLESFASGYRKSDGPFEFVIRGLIDADLERYPATETNLMFFHFKYLSEGLGQGDGLRGQMYTVEIDDPARAAEIGAAIDALFENSGEQTLTETERAFTAEFMSMAGDLAVLVNGIGLAVCFTILLVTANTMSMAVRERRTEIGVLKTLGFASSQVMALIVAEALLLGGSGGALGVVLAQGIVWLLSSARGTTLYGLSAVELKPLVAAAGFGVALLVGLLAGFMPAWGAYRARATELLRSA